MFVLLAVLVLCSFDVGCPVGAFVGVDVGELLVPVGDAVGLDVCFLIGILDVTVTLLALVGDPDVRNAVAGNRTLAAMAIEGSGGDAWSSRTSALRSIPFGTFSSRRSHR